MIADKKEFFTGVALLVGFTVVLVIVFSPVFNGQNGMEWLDSLFNSISKGSAFYIPKVQEESDTLLGNTVQLTLPMTDETQAEQAASLFQKAGATTRLSGNTITVDGDLGKILQNCLEDSKLMYQNEGEEITLKYGYNERRVLYNWNDALNAADKNLKKQKKFKEAKIVVLVIKKAVECAYNYYTVAPKAISDSFGVVIASLVFYVIYTLWYGFAIMYIFEGWGLKLEN